MNVKLKSTQRQNYDSYPLKMSHKCWSTGFKLHPYKVTVSAFRHLRYKEQFPTSAEFCPYRKVALLYLTFRYGYASSLQRHVTEPVSYAGLFCIPVYVSKC